MPRIGGGVPLFVWEGTMNGTDGWKWKDSNPARDSLRAILLLLLMVLTFFAVMLPTIFRNRLSSSHRLVSLFSCIGAGVFLSVCLLDILPDVYENFEKAKLDVSFPLAEASLSLGFLMVLTLEQVAMWMQENHILSSSLHAHSHSFEEQERLTGEDEESSAPTVLPAILLVASLSLHSLFEGLSLAVIPDASKLLQVFLALLIHKTLIGFSLGVRLVSSTLRPLYIVICAFIFSVQVMIGGLAGLWLLHVFSGPVGQVVSASLQGIACGTFLFITTMEVIPHELGHKADFRLLRLLFLFIGFCLIAAFIIIFPEAA